MAPPTPQQYMFQCSCGRMLTIRRNHTVVCPSCQCEHAYADMLPRLEERSPHHHDEDEDEGGAP